MAVTNPKTDPEILAFFSPDAVQICESEAPVSEWPIRMWCRATGDNNPVYQDRDAARRYGHKDVFAPPGMMHAFTMPGLLDPTHDHLLSRLRRKLAEYGLNSTVMGKYEQEFITPIRLGDRLTREVRFESMSDEKATGVGIGHFIPLVEKIVNQNGEVIGNQRMEVLFFRPGTGKQIDQAAKPAKAAPAEAPPAGTVELPPLSIPLTTTLIIAGAVASNDYEPFHHDRDAAQAQGMKDIFMNVLTSCGFAARYVTDWAGPAAVIKGHSTRLMASNFPGDVMTFTGTAEGPFQKGKEMKINPRCTNSLGTHMQSVFTIV
jgi:acyl dehydratase